MNKSTLDAIQLRQTTLEAAAKSGDVKLEGRTDAFGELMGTMDTFPFWFNIVTP
jgi:alkyl sulfatase BDS1-like metallo-beta-lactamase superfamily hydrolase